MSDADMQARIAKLEQENEKLRDEVKESRDKAEESRDEAKESRDTYRKTTFEEFLVACHGVHCSLKIAPPEFSSIGNNTTVAGRQYPALLQRWEQFDTLHQEIYDSICRMLGRQ